MYCTLYSISLIFSLQNYNKSRPHSYRGARHVEVFLDKRLIFRGEIRRASGRAHSDPDSLGEVRSLFYALEVIFHKTQVQ